MKKRIFKYLIVLFAIWFLLYAGSVMLFGGFDIKGTFATKYNTIKESGYKIIETPHFRIKTPSTWVHIFGGYGMEANPHGGFITPKGILRYDIGMWAPTFEIDSIWTFSSKIDTIKSLVITTGIDKKHDEMGISIVNLNGGENLSFFMSSSVRRNYDDLLKGLSEYKNKW